MEFMKFDQKLKYDKNTESRANFVKTLTFILKFLLIINTQCEVQVSQSSLTLSNLHGNL